jgi:hypothetical protein
VQDVTALSPHDAALYEAGKEMLVESIGVGRDFCKFMVGVSTGAIPIYLGLAQLALPQNYHPSFRLGVLIVVPASLFLLAAGVYAWGVFPKRDQLSLESVDSITEARTKAIDRRWHFALAGSALFGLGAVGAILITVAALRVKAPASQPVKPLKVQIVRR